MFKRFMLALALVGVTTFAAGPAFSAPKGKQVASKAKVEKCDKDGKPCSKGKDCKKENCKKPSGDGETKSY